MENSIKVYTAAHRANRLHWICTAVMVAFMSMLSQANIYAQCPQECINFNTLFGKDAGDPMMGGKSNSFFGQNAEKNSTLGDSNSFFGQDAGYSNTTGSDNSFFGTLAGSDNTTGDYNSFFGDIAEANNTTGAANSFFGHWAGLSITTGSYVVCIGNNAGPKANVSNRLYVNVGRSNDPLIYGEFDDNFVRINGTFEVTAGLTNPSSIDLKEILSRSTM